MPTAQIHNDLALIQHIIFDEYDYTYSSPIIELESAEYAACKFELNGLNVLFRVAKITPTKTGQFVTIWKRIGSGPIQPFDLSDNIEFFIINCREGDNWGLFIFPKAILLDKGIISNNNKGGKRAIRVYPPWDKTTSKQAQQSQKWQLNFFFDMVNDGAVDVSISNLLNGSITAS